MKLSEQKRALAIAVKAARLAGKLMRQNLRETKTVNESTQHDIKLELDVRCQKLIEKTLLASFPKVSVVGEEGSSGDPNSTERWIIDPIDGTVNFTYGIPHACVSIALQARISKANSRSSIAKYETIAGLIYDPFTDELWTAIRGQQTRLNGRLTRVSKRSRLSECVIATGFAKSAESVKATLPFFTRVLPRIRKVRIMGSAALALAYVASGRFDAYVERGISLWDIAAGGLLIECAGGEFWRKPLEDSGKFRMIASNGLLRKQLASLQ